MTAQLMVKVNSNLDSLHHRQSKPSSVCKSVCRHTPST